jgi:patatin-like phospholipase/acyl hydrolase
MKLLSLNGGGMCGYMTASLLSKIEEELKTPSYKLFDMICGVSTGSIMAAALGAGKPASEMKVMYRDLGTSIFGNKSWVPWKPWYSSDKLLEAVKDKIEYRFNTAKTRVIIYAARINGPDVLVPKFWKSWKEADDVAASSIVVASCSAPVYFAPKTIGTETYIDGGFVANNPSMCVIAEALSYNAELDNLYNLNITCGEKKGFDNAKKLDSILKWIPHVSDLPTLAIRTGEKAVEYQAHQLIGFRNHVVEPDDALELDTLDFPSMDKLSDAMWSKHCKEIVSQLQIT